MKIAYVGPTILNVATRNTIYDEIPDSISAAAEENPYLLSLCVPISEMASALAQIRQGSGAIYTLYCKAIEHRQIN